MSSKNKKNNMKDINYLYSNSKTNDIHKKMNIENESLTNITEKIAGIALIEELDTFLVKFDHKNLEFLKSNIYFKIR